MNTLKEQTVNIDGANNTCQRIRNLNDELRIAHIGGRILVSKGLSMLDGPSITQILAAVSHFDNFNDDNDPYDEHDCAIIETLGLFILWKIDYYDETLSMHSPDPADENVTSRVLTIMLADEY